MLLLSFGLPFFKIRREFLAEQDGLLDARFMGDVANLWAADAGLPDDVLAAEDLFRRPICDDVLVGHDHDAVKGVNDKIHIVRDDDDADAPLLQVVENLAQDGRMLAVLAGVGSSQIVYRGFVASTAAIVTNLRVEYEISNGFMSRQSLSPVSDSTSSVRALISSSGRWK